MNHDVDKGHDNIEERIVTVAEAVARLSGTRLVIELIPYAGARLIRRKFMD